MKKLLFVCIVLLLTACGQGSKSGDTEVMNLYGIWELQELNGIEVSAEQLPTMALQEDGALNGFTSCNIMNGTFTAKDNGEIAFGEITTTRMSCPDSALESSMLEILSEVERFSVSEGRLTLYTDGKGVAILYAITL